MVMNIRKISKLNKKGVTLFELMVVLVIISIAAVAGTPIFMNLMKDSDVHEASMEFIKDIHANKQTAINESTSLYMYPTSQGDDFSGGWDNFNNGLIISKNIEVVVLITASVPNFGLKFSSNGKIYDAVTEVPLPDHTYTFCYNGDTGIQGREVSINALGKTKIKYVEC
jgi:prepilin-type N-terminal cleavage/methylation domain-containing protein